MTDRLVQKNAVPARAQNHVHLARGAGDGLQIDEGLAQSFVRHFSPLVGPDPALEARATACSGKAVLASPVLFDRDLDIDPRQGAHVADQPAIGPQNFHGPAFAR